MFPQIPKRSVIELYTLLLNFTVYSSIHYEITILSHLDLNNILHDLNAYILKALYVR